MVHFPTTNVSVTIRAGCYGAGACSGTLVWFIDEGVSANQGQRSR
ncbi:hypothetical protein A176_006431 [Myxococcus hansupus]|uniref:Uncharacterized protein n=1 Tax=Pseudomyxococcus hansupus TaxID=1297742 RepID=A0A0H4X2Y8_9BACT|nr:hypothetical protein [Myxococcus hansupus]AKQ69519.1 hypothetical protein A176_006431 [Myxococcus hansupus]